MQFTIGTLNILHPEFAVRHHELAGLVPGTKLSNWQTRKVNIANEILKANLDVLCLQEIGKDSFADLVPSLKQQGYAARHVENPRGDGLAIIYKTNRFSEAFFKPMKVIADSVACVLDLKDSVSGKYARIANCHLLGGPNGPVVGAKQLKEITGAIAIPSPNYKISLKAILGDFNEDHLHDDKKRVLVEDQYATDGVSVITEPAKNRQIDWIFVRSDCKKSVMKLMNIPIPSFILPTSDHHLKATQIKLDNVVVVQSKANSFYQLLVSFWERIAAFFKRFL